MHWHQAMWHLFFVFQVYDCLRISHLYNFLPIFKENTCTPVTFLLSTIFHSMLNDFCVLCPGLSLLRELNHQQSLKSQESVDFMGIFCTLLRMSTFVHNHSDKEISNLKKLWYFGRHLIASLCNGQQYFYKNKKNISNTHRPVKYLTMNVHLCLFKIHMDSQILECNIVLLGHIPLCHSYL